MNNFRAERLAKQALRLLVFSMAAAGLCRGAAHAAATLGEPSGQVFRRTSSSDPWVEISKDQKLEAGDQIRVSDRGSAVIVFDDGSRVELGSGATLAIKEANEKSSALVLGLGRLRALVSKALSRQFTVRTPTAVCSVRGTEWTMNVGPQGQTSVQMISGLLAVADKGGNEVLLKQNESVSVTDKGLGAVQASGGDGSQGRREALKREVGLSMSKEDVQAAAALEQRMAIYQQGKAIIDVNGNRVRIEEYIIRPTPDTFKLVVLNTRDDRFDYFYYKGTFNQTLPTDISVAFRQLPGCIGAPCQYHLTSYSTGRSNTIDNMLELATGGHQVDVNNNGVLADAVTAAYNQDTNGFQAVSVRDPGVNNPALNTRFYQTLFNNVSLTFNGIKHSGWQPSPGAIAAGGNIRSSSDITLDTGANITTVQTNCGPPNCTYNEPGVLRQVIYAANTDGSVWEKYDNYIISNEGQIAKTTDFSGSTSGTTYKDLALKWNYQTIVTASEFAGRKIDLAVDPKIFIESGLFQ